MNRVAFGVGADEFHERFSLVEQIGVGGGFKYPFASPRSSYPLSASYDAGFAKVHRGVDKLTRAPVAVKVRDSRICFRCCFRVSLRDALTRRKWIRHGIFLQTAAWNEKCTSFLR